MRKLPVVAMSLALGVALTACGGSGQSSTSGSAASGSGSAQQAAAESVMEYAPQSYNFDFTERIQAEKAALQTVPQAANIKISASNAMGSTGVVLVPQYGAADSGQYYFNALVANDPVTFTAQDGAKIASATSSLESSDIKVSTDGKTATFTPAPLKVGMNAAISDEVITVTMDSGEKYTIHTASEMLPKLFMTGAGVSEADKGVYSFAANNMLVRVNSDREVIYYRDTTCMAPATSFNFQPDDASGELFFAYDVPINRDLYGGGYSSGFYVIMDKNYREIDLVDMLPNDDPEHKHGEAYIDMHEIRILGEGHYLTLSYTPIAVDNLPEGVQGVDGTSKAYVHAGIFQEIENGKVINEINTTDYPELYASACEGVYAEGTGSYTVARSWTDYIHANALDYILDSEGHCAKIMVSMRSQSALFQFDMNTHNMEWILGGTHSTLSGYDDYTIPRQTLNTHEPFDAIMFGQHYCRYSKVNNDGTMEVTVFDNFTGEAQPYMYETGTITRTFKFAVNPSKGTATVLNCVNGRDLDYITGKDHTADHCASVDYWSDTSISIGWGLHMPVDMGMPAAAQFGWAKGDHCIFTDYNPAQGTVSLELNIKCSPAHEQRVSDGVTGGAMFAGITGAYRTYKNAA